MAEIKQTYFLIGQNDKEIYLIKNLVLLEEEKYIILQCLSDLNFSVIHSNKKLIKLSLYSTKNGATINTCFREIQNNIISSCKHIINFEYFVNNENPILYLNKNTSLTFSYKQLSSNKFFISNPMITIDRQIL